MRLSRRSFLGINDKPKRKCAAIALASNDNVAFRIVATVFELQFKWLCDANSRIPGQLSQFD